MKMSRVLHNQALLLMLFTPDCYRERMWDWIIGSHIAEGQEAIQMVRKKPVAELKERFYSEERWCNFYEQYLEGTA
jgi:hypothetical protein